MIVDAAIGSLYLTPLLEPFPPGTKLFEDDGRYLRWHPRHDAYEAWLYTPRWDSGTWVCTSVSISGQELKRADTAERAATNLLTHKIKLLQMRHWFNLAYSRGGYA